MYKIFLSKATVPIDRFIDSTEEYSEAVKIATSLHDSVKTDIKNRIIQPYTCVIIKDSDGNEVWQGGSK